MAFLHDFQGVFQVFWTTYPLSTPLVVAWCGGPNAEALGCLKPEVIADRPSARSRARAVFRCVAPGQRMNERECMTGHTIRLRVVHTATRGLTEATRRGAWRGR